jgi:hypothetical protein
VEHCSLIFLLLPVVAAADLSLPAAAELADCLDLLLKVYPQQITTSRLAAAELEQLELPSERMESIRNLVH